MDIAEVKPDKPFIDLGLDSIVGVEWVREINATYGTTISATKVYDYATVRALAGYLSELLATANTAQRLNTADNTAANTAQRLNTAGNTAGNTAENAPQNALQEMAQPAQAMVMAATIAPTSLAVKP